MTIPTIDLAQTGANIVNLRKAAGLSVHDLQVVFGFNSPQAIYKWQNGTALPTVDNLIVLAALLHVRIDDSSSLDYPIEIDGKTLYPGQSYEKYLERKKGNHARADWAWRWSKDLFEFGLKNGFVVVKHYDDYSRIYTKTYQNASIKKTGKGFEIEYAQRTRAISSLEFIENEFSNDNAKKNLTGIFESSVFDYSKPVSLLHACAKMSTKDDDLILDFFSGSATTAHAVMQLNAEDGGNRKFIMVQLPEETDAKSEAYKAGYKNICEIGKERIRRAGNKIKADSPLTTKDLDTGFRVLKLDSSNMKDVYYSPADYQSLLTILNHMQ